jgi:hypothetical protein
MHWPPSVALRSLEGKEYIPERLRDAWQHISLSGHRGEGQQDTKEQVFKAQK